MPTTLASERLSGGTARARETAYVIYLGSARPECIERLSNLFGVLLSLLHGVNRTDGRL